MTGELYVTGDDTGFLSSSELKALDMRAASVGGGLEISTAYSGFGGAVLRRVVRRYTAGADARIDVDPIAFVYPQAPQYESPPATPRARPRFGVWRGRDSGGMGRKSLAPLGGPAGEFCGNCLLRLWRTAMTRVPVGPLQLLDIYHLLSDEERAVQQSVRRLVDETIRPNIAQWYEDGVFPAEVAPRFGKLGLLGMHLEAMAAPV